MMVSVECSADVGRGRAPGDASSRRVVDFSDFSHGRTFHFIGGDLNFSAAMRVGWSAFRQAMRSWGVQSELEV